MSQRAEELLQRVDEVIGRVDAAKFKVLEDTGLLKVSDELVERVDGALAETVALLREIQEAYDAEAAGAGAGDHTGPIDASEVADLCYMSRAELTGHMEALAGSHAQNQVWMVLHNADTGLGRSERALIAVETAIREHEGLDPVYRSYFNLEDSISIRSQYAHLRGALESQGSPSGDDLVSALSDVVTYIGALRDLDIYVRMRIVDRRQIRALQKRILAALEAPTADGEHDRAVLWQDLVGCVQLLLEINHREELRKHDRRIVREAHGLLTLRGRDDDEVPASALETMKPLLGRDGELDAILLSPAGRTAGEARAALGRLREALG